MQNRLTTSHVAKMDGKVKDGKPHDFLRRSSSSLTRLLKLGKDKRVDNFVGTSSSLRKSTSRHRSVERTPASASASKFDKSKGNKNYNQKIISKSSIPNLIH